MKRRPKPFENQALGALFTLLHIRPQDLVRAEGIPYQTIYALLYINRSAAGTTLTRVVRGLQAIARKRAEEGKSTLPPEAITAEAICPPPPRPLSLIRKVKSKHTRKQGAAA